MTLTKLNSEPDPDWDFSIFIIDPQDANKKLICLKTFLLISF
jgi:hypothetical protein